MKGIFDGYSTVEAQNEAYFIGANTGRGFVNLGESLLREGVNIEHLVIVKGGAGTGKSTLMKKAVTEAKKNGFPVVTYLCGSDPDSLDAVVIDGRIGIADGTMPHVLEMKYPGVCSGVADVSACLDGEKLRAQKDRIMALTREKSRWYGAAYRYLKGAEALDSESAEVMNRAAEEDKIRAYAERTVKNLCGRDVMRTVRDVPAAMTNVYVGGITMKGRAGLSTLEEKAEQVIGIRDVYGFASGFLETLGKVFAERGLSVVWGRIPLNDRIKELYLPQLGVVFSVNAGREAVRQINLRRFVAEERYKKEEGRLKLTQKCIDSMVQEGINCLAKAGENHFALERINTDAMDFKALNRFGNRVISEIMKKLTTS